VSGEFKVQLLGLGPGLEDERVFWETLRDISNEDANGKCCCAKCLAYWMLKHYGALSEAKLS